ncbi:alpha/beta hydrolase [Sphingosinicella rhizophila]|uniref:Alpha/beta hydrolase n=1 Tax=Sphingosinicella rhizophila TaxID=3050082 RepID=A0ABU3Q5D3_9SPHN|nr:alpha/beta hydrolase [Sphingosinicella sp. GR2756]MDT9598150.1 alpha/beta hydrolase [Sphingosinicella sp. GR2756]
MSSRHLIDPELLPLLETFPTITITHDNLAARRARVFPVEIDRNDDVSLEILSAPGPEGAPDIRIHVYRPIQADGPLPVLYHIHGGGYVSGSAAQLEAFHRPLAADLGCALVAVDYRLAPETIFPGALEDCHAGLGWVFGQAGKRGFDIGRVGLMGESAGGGLAAGLALLARDRGDYPILFQHLIYPMLDDRTCVAADPNPFAGEFGWHAANNHFGWSAMLGGKPGGENVSPYAAPARAEALAGLPPTFLSVGALDLFVDENLDYARRLMRAGVPVELHIWPGAFHGFDYQPGAFVAEAARRASRDALRRAFRVGV